MRTMTRTCTTARSLTASSATDRADAYIIRFCEVIKRLAVDRLHIVGDLFDRGPRPDQILTG